MLVLFFFIFLLQFFFACTFPSSEDCFKEYEPSSPSPSWPAACTLTFSLLSFTIPSHSADSWHGKASCIFQERPAGCSRPKPPTSPCGPSLSLLQLHGQQLKKGKANFKTIVVTIKAQLLTKEKRENI